MNRKLYWCYNMGCAWFVVLWYLSKCQRKAWSEAGAWWRMMGAPGGNE